MSPRLASRWVAASVLMSAMAAAPFGCPPCERSLCEAVDAGTVPLSIDQGIRGVIAVYSDVIADTCQPCEVYTTYLGLWHIDEPLFNAELVQELTSERDADHLIEVHGAYARPLDPGFYLVCAVAGPCASIEVRPHDQVTVSSRYVSGLLVFDSDGERIESASIDVDVDWPGAEDLP